MEEVKQYKTVIVDTVYSDKVEGKFPAVHLIKRKVIKDGKEVYSENYIPRKGPIQTPLRKFMDWIENKKQPLPHMNPTGIAHEWWRA